ncbi:MAG: sugar phosphate nucleotidyltransferase [Promethearchaeota archaeon]
MKALVLSGGKGADMSPLSDGIPKTMIKLHGKPIIQYALEGIQALGINEITVVVGYEKDKTIEFISTYQFPNLEIDYIEQSPPFDSVEAALLTALENLLGEEHFLLVYGDIVAPPDFYRHLFKSFNNTKANATLCATLKGKTADFGVIQINSEGLISKIVERPSEKERTDLGNYIFAGAAILPITILKDLESGKAFPSTINKFLKEDKGHISAAIWDKGWVDVGVPWDLLHANKIAFKNVNHSQIASTAKISSSSIIEGLVIIEDNAVIDHNVVLKGPVYIGKNSYIGTNSLLRENTSIEDNVTIGYSVEIKNSIIEPYSTVGRTSFIGDSIIGTGTDIRSMVTFQNELLGKRIKRGPIEIRGTIYTKLGAVIGNNTDIGPNTVIYPAEIVGSNQTIKAGSIIDRKIQKNK